MKVQRAFTLIELLIVIAIIGILAGVVLVSTNNSREKANVAKVYSTLESISKLSAICHTMGEALNPPGDTATPNNVTICPSSSSVYPDISSTGFKYCGSPLASGSGCRGWYQNTASLSCNKGYAISVRSVSGPDELIICGDNCNWSAIATVGDVNLLGTSGCKKCKNDGSGVCSDF